MKLIHCADLHIGSKMDSKYPSQKAQLRRQELRNAFVEMVELAEEEGISAILIAGDAFDSDHPGEKDLEYFYGVIASHPDIRFYYLRGNHDVDGYGPDEPLNNLFSFSSDRWTTYVLEDEKVTISGIEINPENSTTYYDAPGLEPKAGFYNIGMLHGQVGSSINLKRLAHRDIRYYALGHIHSLKRYELEDRGTACYSGTLEPRGFDETGDKGFVVLDTETRRAEFRRFNKRTVYWEELDISDFRTEFDISTAIKARLEGHSKDIFRVELTGQKAPDLHIIPGNIASRCAGACFLLDVIDSSSSQFAISAKDSESPLTKEFISRIKENGNLSDEEKAEAINIGLRALSGREF